MSEQAPQSSPENSPERKRRLTDNCDTCKKDYELTPNNSFLFHYAGQDECDNMLCKCPHCKAQIRIFIGEDTFMAAIDNGIEPICDDRNAPEDIYSRWCRLMGIELPKTYELTDRHEATIRKFGENLLAIPDEVFWDNIEAETDRPFPQKWID